MSELYKLLRCPETNKDFVFDEEDQEFFTDESSYPLLNNLPILYPNIEETFLNWSSKINKFLEQEKSFLSYVKTLVKLEKNELRRDRFSKIFEAKSGNIKVIEQLLTSFLNHESTSLTPSTQQIHSYFNNIFRDWSWKNEEIQSYKEFCLKYLEKEGQKVLILGSGAGRLSYELANENPRSHFYSLDHNPFLAYAAQTITSGNKLNLWNIEYYPKMIEGTAKLHNLKFPKLKNENHLFLLGTFPCLPFDKASFDLIICPWFLDILDTNFSDGLKLSNYYLKENGVHLYIGPSNIHSNDLYEQFTSEEIIQTYQECFENVVSDTKSLEYLANPLASQTRLENVLFVKAKNKIKEQKPTKSDLKNNDKLEYNERLEDYKQTNQVLAVLLSKVTKDTNAFELSLIMAKEFNIDQEHALYYSKNLIQKIKSDLKNS